VVRGEEILRNREKLEVTIMKTKDTHINGEEGRSEFMGNAKMTDS
jgi:hypothetical protein